MPAASTRTIKLLMPLLSAAVVGAFALAAWSFASSHSRACASRNRTLDVLHDVIVIAVTPAPGQKLTSKQADDIAKFEARVFARINQARC